MDQVVELGPARDAGLLEGPAVNRGVGSNLNVVLDDQRSLLWELSIFPVGSIADVAEAVCSQYRPGVDHHPVTERGPGVDDHAGINLALAADADAGSDDSSAANDGSVTNAGSLLDRGVSTNRDPVANLNRRVNH